MCIDRPPLIHYNGSSSLSLEIEAIAFDTSLVVIGYFDIEFVHILLLRDIIIAIGLLHLTQTNQLNLSCQNSQAIVFHTCGSGINEFFQILIGQRIILN